MIDTTSKTNHHSSVIVTPPPRRSCSLELLKETTRAAAVVPLEILQSLAAANTLMTMTDDDDITRALSSDDDYSSSSCPPDSSSCEGGSCRDDSTNNDNEDSSSEEGFSSPGDVDNEESSNHDHDSTIPPGIISLYSPADENNIGTLHNLFRRDIYEGYIVPPNQKYEGTVAFRCRFCAHLPVNQRAKQSEVYPRSIETLYRAHIRFNHDHYPVCEYIPKEIRGKVGKLKKGGGGDDASSSLRRGSKGYWVTSALSKGLRNSKEGIVLCGLASK